MRQPSIHITEKKLYSILLKELGEDIEEKEIEKLTKRILMQGKNHSLSHRIICVTNEKLNKKTEKVRVNNRTDSGLFANLLHLLRKQRKHRGIELIKPGHNDWLMIKELSAMANEFCNEFGLSLKEGYREYITQGLNIMKSYGLNKFKSLHATIFKKYEAHMEVQQDEDPEGTQQLYNIYVGIINEKTGLLLEDYQANPEKYLCFVKARQIATRVRASFDIYIKAQFHGLEWVNGIPLPEQLYGEKAMERLSKYCMEKEIKLNQKTSKKVDFKKIRHGN